MKRSLFTEEQLKRCSPLCRPPHSHFTTDTFELINKVGDLLKHRRLLATKFWVQRAHFRLRTH